MRLVRGFPPFSHDDKHGRIALVGETLGDVREVMIDGPSGIRSLTRGDRPRFEASRRRLVWANGAVAQMFSSEDPESLRGPQFSAAWCDEAGQMEERRGDVRHAAVRPAAGRRAAPDRDDDAAARRR